VYRPPVTPPVTPPVVPPVKPPVESPGISEAQWAAVADGMTEAQVVAILGAPFRATNTGGLRVLVYAFVNSDSVAWVFLKAGVVIRRNRA
jgi:hypothetical protein